MQFDYLVSRGLRPEHVFLDIACGSLRGGIHFIPYLDRGHYLGLDQDEALIRCGLDRELEPAMREQKAPEFVVSDSFEFDRFSKVADFSLAQSLFTHLVVPDIELCLRNLSSYAGAQHQFYATFHNGDGTSNPPESGPHKNFLYSPDELAEMGTRTGWHADHLGDWGHPRGQEMMLFRAS